MRSKPGVLGQFINRRMRISGGPPAPAPDFDPSQIFAAGAWGDWGDFREPEGLFQDVGGTTPVADEFDPIARFDGRAGNVSISNSSSSTQFEWSEGLANLRNAALGGGLRLNTLAENSPVMTSATLYLAWSIDYTTAPTGFINRALTRDVDGNTVRQDIRSTLSSTSTSPFSGLLRTTSRSASVASGTHGFDCIRVPNPGTDAEYHIDGTAIAGATDTQSIDIESQQLASIQIFGRAEEDVQASRIIGFVIVDGGITDEQLSSLNAFYGVS